MKKLYFGLMALFSGAMSYAQDASYFVGSGSDTAYLVIDFQDNTEDSSSVWGYLFDASATVTGGDMLADVAADEQYLNIATGSGYLDDIIFNDHEGIGGTNGYYWGTWSKDAGTAWTANTGLGEVLSNGDWFGCSFINWTPIAIEPGTPQHAYASNWFDASKVDYWVGSGSSTAYLVADFVESGSGEAVSFVWGVKFDGTWTGEDMLQTVADEDMNFDVDMTGGFLNDIVYGAYEGLAGQPNYWGTFSGANLSDWTFNSGIGETVNDGDLYGVAYASWPPRRPIAPINAVDPDATTKSDINDWIGTGSDSAVLVIDFNDGTVDESIAFGVLFNTSATLEDALNLLSGYYGMMTVDMTGGYLNDITFGTHSGIGGTNFNYWSTWSGSNGGDFEMNVGISTTLSNGDWAGFSFTDWNPALLPSVSNAFPSTANVENENFNISLYPNPTVDLINIKSDLNEFKVNVFSVDGKLVKSTVNEITIDLSELNTGVYFVEVISNGSKHIDQIIKQ